MEYFLKEIEIIRKEYKMLADREEKFNIFSALHKDHDERRLHSRFISVLLQPKGRHGQKELFLDLFLSQFTEITELEENEKINLDYSKTIVYPKEFDKKENNNIDILIIDKSSNQALIIENKIYAGDSITQSGGQIERYLNHVINDRKIPEENTFLIYLTLDGHEPSYESVGEKYNSFNNIFPLSYVSLIIPWLEKSLKEVPTLPFLREAIVQYIKLVKKMTGNKTSKEEILKYKNLISSSQDTMNATKTLIDNFKHVKWHCVHETWVKIKQKILSNNYKIVNDFKNSSITDTTHYEPYRVGQKKKQNISIKFLTSNEVKIEIIFSANYGHFYFGCAQKNKENDKFREQLEKIEEKYPKYKTNNWMYLHKIFDTDIKFNDFEKKSTFNLIIPQNQDELADNVWSEVVELIEIVEKEIK